MKLAKAHSSIDQNNNENDSKINTKITNNFN